MGLIGGGMEQLLGRGFPELKLFTLAMRFRRFYGFAQVVLVVLHLCAFGFGLVGRPLIFSRFPPFGSNVAAFAALLNDSMLLAHCVFAIVATTRPTPLPELLYAVLGDRHLHNQWRFRVYVTLLRLLPLVPIGAEVWLYWDLYGYLVHRGFCYYCMNLMVYSCARILQQINGTFRAVNDQLELFGRQLRRPGVQRLQWRLALDQLSKLRNSFGVLYRLIDTFNSYAKGMLVVVVTCLCINILFNLTVITQFAIRPPDPSTKMLVYLIHTLFTLTSVGQAAVVAFVGEGLEEEGERTTRICYTLLNQLNNSAKVEPLIARELHFILEHSRARKVCLHAGGFFRINWGILGSITSTVATYSIVIIQFLLK